MRVHSPALTNTKYLPTKYATKQVRGGQNISLPVKWEDVPGGTKSFVLSIIDRHPIANNWVHWYVLNIPPSTREIPEGASGDTLRLPAGSMELRNSFGGPGYGGPQPPRGSGPHEYAVTVYALNVESLSLGLGSTPDECLNALEGTVLASATAVGIFEQ